MAKQGSACPSRGRLNMNSHSPFPAIRPASSISLELKFAVALMLPGILIGLPLDVRAAEYAAIEVELNSTWESANTTNRHSITASCVVGPDDWFISGDFLKNARVDCWLIGTNVVEHRVVTSSMHLQRARDFVSERILKQKARPPMLFSYPRAGTASTTVRSWEEPFGSSQERLVWLAFCSESYLQLQGRQIPMPLGPPSDASGYSDRTVLFENESGLPKHVRFYTNDGRLIWEYEVLDSTNVFGRTFPLEFRLLQHGLKNRGGAGTGSKSIVLGRVSSIRSGKQPELPEEVRKELEQREDAP